jgi:hypothetical protein
MNLVEQLLKIDAGKIEVPSKEVKLKLAKLGNAEITFTCNAISMERYNEIQERVLQVDKKGNIQGFATAQAKIETVLAGVSELRSEELMKHFKAPTPKELMNKIFLPGEVDILADTVTEVSGVEAVSNKKEDIKNS